MRKNGLVIEVESTQADMPILIDLVLGRQRQGA
jgi:hypothetical protein